MTLESREEATSYRKLISTHKHMMLHERKVVVAVYGETIQTFSFREMRLKFLKNSSVTLLALLSINICYNN